MYGSLNKLTDSYGPRGVGKGTKHRCNL